MRATPSFTVSAAAFTTRLSSPSQSTMVLFKAFALNEVCLRQIIWNFGAVLRKLSNDFFVISHLVTNYLKFILYNYVNTNETAPLFMVFKEREFYND